LKIGDFGAPFIHLLGDFVFRAKPLHHMEVFFSTMQNRSV